MNSKTNRIVQLNEALNLVEAKLSKVNLSMSDLVDINSKIKSGSVENAKLDHSLHGEIRKRWGMGKESYVTIPAKANHDGKMTIDTRSGGKEKHMEFTVMGNYLMVKTEGAGTEYFEIR